MGECEYVKSVELPNSIQSVDSYAFYGCSGLASITIPDSVASVGGFAFYGCSGLTDVYYSGSVEQWEAISFEDYNTYLTDATIHYNSTGLDDGIPGKDMAYGSVMFLTGWSNTEKTVTFADTPISYSVVDETDLTFLVSWPEICYSYVQVTSDSAYHLINIEPVESHIGVASAATENTLTIDGTQYYIAGDGQIILDAFVGRRVLYHLLDGVIVGIENAASVDESDYKIKTGEEGKLYAAFKSLPGETISYHFISSDSSVVSFSSDGGSSESINWSITPTDPMEAYNGIHTADTFYAMKPGTVTVTCTTSDGIQYTRTIIVQSEEDDRRI